MKPSLFAFLIAAITIVTGCHRKTPPTEEPAPKVVGDTIIFSTNSPQLKSIAVAQVTLRPNQALSISGRLVWNEDVTVRIYPPFGGRVTRILTKLGDRVKEGDPLVALASPDFSQMLEDARKASTDLHLAEGSLARLKELSRIGAASAKDLKASEADFARATASFERTSRNLASLGASSNMIDQTFLLRSPITGLVVEKNLNPGQEVGRDLMTANIPPLFVVSDPSKLWLMLDVPESDLHRLKPGQKLTVISRSTPGKALEGQIDFIGAGLDPLTRTVKIRANVENLDGLLKAEMYVSAEASEGLDQSIQISSKAVFLLENEHYVFLETGPGQFRRTAVKLGPERAGNVTVLEGLNPTMKIATDGCLLLQSFFEK